MIGIRLAQIHATFKKAFFRQFLRLQRWKTRFCQRRSFSSIIVGGRIPPPKQEREPRHIDVGGPDFGVRIDTGMSRKHLVLVDLSLSYPCILCVETGLGNSQRFGER